MAYFVQDLQRSMWNARDLAAVDTAAAAAEAVHDVELSNVVDAMEVPEAEEASSIHVAETRAADGELVTAGAKEAAEVGEQGETGEAAGTELTAAGNAAMEGTARDGVGSKRAWPWQAPFFSPGASPLEGLRRRFQELFPPKEPIVATMEQEMDHSSSAEGEAAQGPLQVPAADADARPLETGVFASSEDRLQHFSLHRSHRRMYVSTAETAAAMAEKDKLQEVGETAVAASSEGQLEPAVAEGTSSTDMPEGDDARSEPWAGAEYAEQPEAPPAAEHREEDLGEPLQESPADEAEDAAPGVEEGTVEDAGDREEGHTAQEEAPVPAAAELMKVDVPSFSLPEQQPQPEPQVAEAETAEAETSTAAAPQQPEEAGLAADSSQDAKEPEQAQASQPAAEAEPAPALAELQSQPQPQPTAEEDLAAPVDPVSQEPALPVVGEAAALRTSKPDLAPSAAPVVSTSPDGAGGGRASSKAKHSWQSPALSARYGEVEDNEPRYKPRRPDADASASPAQYGSLRRQSCYTALGRVPPFPHALKIVQCCVLRGLRLQISEVEPQVALASLPDSFKTCRSSQGYDNSVVLCFGQALWAECARGQPSASARW